METPNRVQKEVQDKHNRQTLVDKAKEIVMIHRQGDLKFISQFLISSTQRSQVLIVIGDYQDELPYNSYSGDNNNPWLITGSGFQVSQPEFHKNLKEYWRNTIHVPADWTICPFRVYEWKENESKWEARALEVGNHVVRVTVEDQKFWCHPPRPFQVLESACKKASNNRYNQIKENLSKEIEALKNVDTNTDILEDRKPERKSELKKSIKSIFNNLYELVEELPWNDPSKLTSYGYPTLQMEVKTESGSSIRFGADSSGVYKAKDNEAHYCFKEEGTEPIPKPTKEAFWNWVVNSLKITNPPTYQELFLNQ